jgi:hypothetical protein
MRGQVTIQRSEGRHVGSTRARWPDLRPQGPPAQPACPPAPSLPGTGVNGQGSNHAGPHIRPSNRSRRPTKEAVRIPAVSTTSADTARTEPRPSPVRAEHGKTARPRRHGPRKRQETLRSSRSSFGKSNTLPLGGFTHSLTLSSEFFSTFPRGTCSLSVSWSYLALGGVYLPLWAALSSNPTPRETAARARLAPVPRAFHPLRAERPPLSIGLGLRRAKTHGKLTVP